MAGKVGAFQTQLETQIGRDNVKTQIRRQLPSNIFVQFLAGPREVRTGIIGFLLKSVAWISLIAGPIALLVLFQLQFLPYHSECITNWQRIAVVIDLILLWFLWPPIARGEARLLGWEDFGRLKVLGWAGVSVLPLLLVVTIATFPGEWLEENLPSFRFVPTAWPKLSPESAQAGNVSSRNQSPKAVPQSQPSKTPAAGSPLLDKSNNIITTILALMKLGSLDELLAASFADYVPLKETFASTEPSSLHELLVASDVNYVTDRPKSLWSNVLVLPDFKAGDRVRFDAEGTIAVSSDTVSLRGRALEGAVLVDAHLGKADFTGAQLAKASFYYADLREAKFKCAKLGYKEGCAQLRGASLYHAQLQGADLVGAGLQGADVILARLQAALFGGAQLQGASLAYAQLQGADLVGAGLQGADLGHTQLQGADLDGAQLQGADLEGARLQGASLDNPFVWRTNTPDEADVKGAFLAAPEARPKYLGLDCRSFFSRCGWSAKSYAALKSSMPMPGLGYLWFGILRLEKPPYLQDEASAKAWRELEKSSPSPEVYFQGLAEELKQIGCGSDGTPYVIGGLIEQLDSRFRNGPSNEATVAAAFLDEAKCPGARGLSEENKAKLREIRDRATAAAGPGVSPH